MFVGGRHGKAQKKPGMGFPKKEIKRPNPWKESEKGGVNFRAKTEKTRRSCVKTEKGAGG